MCAYSCSWFFRARQSRPSIRPCRLNIRCILSSWYIFVLAGRSGFNLRLFDKWCAIPVSLSHCARLCAVWVWVCIPVQVRLFVRLPPSVRGLFFAWRYSFDETSYLAVNFQLGRTFSTSERHEATTGPGSSVPEKAGKEEEEEELEAEETWIRFLVES